MSFRLPDCGEAKNVCSNPVLVPRISLPNFLAGIRWLLPKCRVIRRPITGIGKCNKLCQQHTQRAAFTHEGSSLHFSCLSLMPADEILMSSHVKHNMVVREGMGFHLHVNTHLRAETAPTHASALLQAIESHASLLTC